MVYRGRVWRVVVLGSIVDCLATNHARRLIGARVGKDCVAQLLPLVAVAAAHMLTAWRWCTLPFALVSAREPCVCGALVGAYLVTGAAVLFGLLVDTPPCASVFVCLCRRVVVCFEWRDWLPVFRGCCPDSAFEREAYLFAGLVKVIAYRFVVFGECSVNGLLRYES